MFRRLVILTALLSLVYFGLAPVARAEEAVKPTGRCFGIKSENQEHCGKVARCTDDPLCYWGFCQAKDVKDQTMCNTRKQCENPDGGGAADGKCSWVRQEGKKPAAGVPGSCDSKNKDSQCIALENPLQGSVTDVAVVIGRLIRAALSLIGALTLLMLVWGGFTWLTSAGNPERVKKGTQTMVWAAIGVLLVFASYFIVTNFIEYLTGTQ